jgi:hypothetical protein
MTKKKRHVLQVGTISTEKEKIMCKRILTNLFAVASVAVIGLAAVNEAKAAPTTIKVNEVCKNILFDVDGPTPNDSGGFDFTYTLKSGTVDVQNLSYLSLGIDRRYTVGSEDPVLGEGNSDGWLTGAPLKTITITPQDIIGTEFTISVSGDDVYKGELFAYTKAGRTIESCVIEGPGFQPPPCPGLPIDVTVPKTKIVALNDNMGGIFEYCIDIDTSTGCPYPDAVPYECGTSPKKYLDFDDDFVIGSSADNGDTTGPTYPTMIMGEGMDPRCPVAKAAHNPCQWVILSGRPYGPVCW